MSLITDGLSDVKEKYELMEVLGSGSYGTVRKCKNKKTGQLAACKTIEKSVVDDIIMLEREIEIMKTVHHPHIIELYDVYEDVYSIHLVTELCTGGELYDRVIEKAESPEGHFSEDDAAILTRDILDAIRYMHDECNIVHRDLKPENFLLKDERDDAPLKIIDFGLSRKNDAPFGLMSSRVGSPYYVAPEVLTDSYTYKCDIWSIGVIAYILLCGFAPFSGDTDWETIQMVQEAKLEFPSPEWDNISKEARDFCAQLLQKDAYLRPTAAEALKHPWIAKYVVVAPSDVPKPRPFFQRGKTDSSVELRMDSERRSAFQKFLGGIKVRKAVGGAINLMTAGEARQMAQVFKEIDKDRDGIASVEDIDHAVETCEFSSSLKQNLKEMRNTLAKHAQLSFNVRPFVAFLDGRSKSE